jgi:hypothetical protein
VGDGERQFAADFLRAVHRAVTPARAEWLLKCLLRLAGGVLCLGAPAALLPLAWMGEVHAALGLGVMPSGRIVEYLARSAGLVYAMHGVLMLTAARDVRRFAPIVTVIGISHIAFGVAMLVLDIYVGMPLDWTLGEGPPVAAVGIAVLLLQRWANVGILPRIEPRP